MRAHQLILLLIAAAQLRVPSCNHEEGNDFLDQENDVWSWMLMVENRWHTFVGWIGTQAWKHRYNNILAGKLVSIHVGLLWSTPDIGICSNAEVESSSESLNPVRQRW